MRFKKQVRRSSVSRRPAGASMVEGLEGRLLMARIAGIDVSHYQGTGINWTNVKNAGYTFAWTKATEGLTYNDDTFTTNMANAKGKVLIGPYHFARYDNQQGTSGASSEENHFWNIIKGYYTTANAGSYMAPMLDLENATSSVNPGTAGYTKTTFSQWALRFLNDLKTDLQSVGINLTPVVYTGASFAGSWLDSTISASFPLWMANYNGYSRDTGSPFWNGSGSTVYGSPWQRPGGWQFWQYTSSAHVSGVGDGTTTNVDADVFIGDIYSLKSDYVIGGAPRWDVGERVVANTSVNAWATSAANTTNTPVASGSYATVLNAVPVYGNSFWRWQVRFDNNVTGWVGEDFLDTATPGAPSGPAPSNNGTTYLTSLPANFTWAAANASSYDVYLDGSKRATVTTNSWAHPSIADGTHTWYVVAHNSELATTGSTWTFKLDATAPTAVYGGQSPSQGAATMTFTVTYADATSGLLASSLGDGDVVVTGPNGYSQVATFVSVDSNANGTPRVATYSITAPDGAWDVADNGTYTISQAGGEVRDVAGNVRAAGTIGTFAVGLPPAYVSGSTLYINYPAPGTVTISASGGTIVVGQGGNDYTFDAAAVAAIAINMTDGSDVLSLFGNIPAPISVAGAGGLDQVAVNASAQATFASDLPGDAVTVGAGAVLSAGQALHLTSLTVNGGTVTAAAGGAATLAVGNLLIVNGGSVDLADNALVWNYSGGSPTDTLRTYLYRGRDGGTWSGAGGVRSSAAADDATHATGLGYLEASDLGVSTFAGADADGTTLVVKYTLAGDVNLDGRIDADDYALTDRGFARAAADAHWIDGDFDYDGILGAGDYLVLDTSTVAAGGGGAPSPALLAAREAAFGPAYVRALLAATEPAPVAPTGTFSEAPIADTTTPPLSDPAASAPVAAAPFALVTVPKKVRRNKPAAFGFAVAGAPSGRFTYKVDWNADGVADQTVTRDTGTLVLTHKFARAGRHAITFWVTDDATGLTSEPAALSFLVA